MKIYNPFKPHLVQFTDGSYAYRKFDLVSWVLLDRDGGHWWYRDGGHWWFSRHPYWQLYCYGTKEQAEAALVEWNNRSSTPKYDKGTLV